MSLLLTATTVIPLPLSKEAVMLEASLTLSEKRRLFRALKALASLPTPDSPASVPAAAWLQGQHEISPDSRLGQLILYGACRCASALEATTQLSLSAAIDALRSLEAGLRSVGTGLVLCQWGSSELSQAACRRSALHGAIQIMNPGDCARARQELPRAREVFRRPGSGRTLHRWAFLVRRWAESAQWWSSSSSSSGSAALFTVPPNSDVNPTQWTLNILQLSSSNGYCSSPSGKSCSVSCGSVDFVNLCFNVGCVNLCINIDFVNQSLHLCWLCYSIVVSLHCTAL